MTRDVRNQPFAPGEDGGLGAIHQLQLAQDIADVTFHGFLTDDQPSGDFPVGESSGDEPQDLAFAFAQHRVLRSVSIGNILKFLRNACCHLWMHGCLAASRFAYGVCQLRQEDIL